MTTTSGSDDGGHEEGVLTHEAADARHRPDSNSGGSTTPRRGRGNPPRPCGVGPS